MSVKVKNIFDYCLATEPYTEEFSLSSYAKDFISTSSTIVPTVTSPAGAHSSKSKDFDMAFANIISPAHTSQTCQACSGTIFSYTSSLVNGRMSEKYGLEKSYSDFRLQLKLYNENKASMEHPNQFWKAKVRELI